MTDIVVGARPLRSSLWVILSVLAMAALLLVALGQQDTPDTRGVFTPEQRAFLEREYQRGIYGRDRGRRSDTYTWCDGFDTERDVRRMGRWTTYYAVGDWEFSPNACWLNLMPSPTPRRLSPDWTHP